jgi:hypothetical protein
MLLNLQQPKARAMTLLAMFTRGRYAFDDLFERLSILSPRRIDRNGEQPEVLDEPLTYESA